MGKGANTKKMILIKAAELFSLKGYVAVTMKDICDSTGLSRGGLYRHFSSTKEIFIENLNRDLEINTSSVEEAIKRCTPAGDIVQYYFNQEKAAVLGRGRGFYFAVHEFAFHEPDQREYFKKRWHDSYTILSGIFQYGQDRGELKGFDIEAVSMHILYFWDSLKTSSSILSLTEAEIDNQIDLMKGMLI